MTTQASYLKGGAFYSQFNTFLHLKFHTLDLIKYRGKGKTKRPCWCLTIKAIMIQDHSTPYPNTDGKNFDFRGSNISKRSSAKAVIIIHSTVYFILFANPKPRGCMAKSLWM